MRLGSGYTVEEQITKKAVFGGIQLDVFPRRAQPPHRAFAHPDTSAAFAVDKTPQELGLIPLMNTISFDPWKTRNISSEPASKEEPWSLEGYRRKTGCLTLTAYYNPPILNSPWGDSTGRVVRRNRPAPGPVAMQALSTSMHAYASSSFQLQMQQQRRLAPEICRQSDVSTARIGLAAGGSM